MHSVVLVNGLSHRKSVRPSVCLSVFRTRGLYTHMVWPTIMISSLYGYDSSFLAPNFVSTFQRLDLQIQDQTKVE